MESDLPNHFPGQLKSESIRISGCMLSVPSWTSYFVLALFHKWKASNPPSFFRRHPAEVQSRSTLLSGVPLSTAASNLLTINSIAFQPAFGGFSVYCYGSLLFLC